MIEIILPIAALGSVLFLYFTYWFWSTFFGLDDYKSIICTLVVLAVILRILISFTTPTFYASDEEAHFKYISFIAENYQLPTFFDCPGNKKVNNCYEYYQPPLYYLLLSPLYILFESIGFTKYYLVRSLRLTSIFFWSINFFFVKKGLEEYLPGSEYPNKNIKVLILTFVAFLPTYVNLTSLINNDVLLITWGGIIFYLLSVYIKEMPWLALGVLLGIALLTKSSGAIYPVWVVGVLGIKYYKRDKNIKRFLKEIGKLSIISAAIWSPLVIRNLSVYGSIIPFSIGNKLFDPSWSSYSQALKNQIEYMIKSYWAVAGIYNNISIKIYWRFGVFLGLLGIGGWLFNYNKKIRTINSGFLNFLVGSIPALIFNLYLVIFIMGVQYRQAQGRFLFPLLVPLFSFLVTGIFNLYPRHATINFFPAVIFGYSVQFFTYVLYTYLFIKVKIPFGAGHVGIFDQILFFV
jgi:hypothetical protein